MIRVITRPYATSSTAVASCCLSNTMRTGLPEAITRARTPSLPIPRVLCHTPISESYRCIAVRLDSTQTHPQLHDGHPEVDDCKDEKATHGSIDKGRVMAIGNVLLGLCNHTQG